MKRILLGLAIAITALTVTPQRSEAQDYAGQLSAPKVFANATFDTVKVNIPYNRSAITFKYDILKNSGTVGGTIVLKGRIGGSAIEQWDTIDSYTLTDATITKSVKLTANHYVEYAVIRTTTGTQNSTHTLFVLYRKTQ